MYIKLFYLLNNQLSTQKFNEKNPNNSSYNLNFSSDIYNSDNYATSILNVKHKTAKCNWDKMNNIEEFNNFFFFFFYVLDFISSYRTNAQYRQFKLHLERETNASDGRPVDDRTRLNGAQFQAPTETTQDTLNRLLYRRTSFECD